MSDTIRLSPQDLETLIAQALTASGATEANAVSVARALAQAEIDGHHGHGISRIPSYTLHLKCGKVDGTATPEARRPRPALIAVDAKHGFAYPALDVAIAALAQAVPEQGAAFAGITRSHHFGVAGYHAERLAGHGLMAIVIGNAPKAIAAWGGKRAMFGTNPIAFAAPRRAAPPVVIDMALSRAARGLVMAAAQTGEPIPADWALDAQGRPTTNAKAALAGTMLPIGGAKGAALAMMIDMICGAVLNASFGFEASSLFDGEGGPPRLAQLLIAFDPGGFAGAEVYAERIARLIAEIESEEGVRLPGSRRLTRRAEAARSGVVIPARLVETARAIAGERP